MANLKVTIERMSSIPGFDVGPLKETLKAQVVQEDALRIKAARGSEMIGKAYDKIIEIIEVTKAEMLQLA
jgi:hypothetical protein